MVSETTFVCILCALLCSVKEMLNFPGGSLSFLLSVSPTIYLSACLSLCRNLQALSPPVPTHHRVLGTALRAWTHREAPVDVRHLGVQVEAEDEEQDARHHAGTAADKLKEVDAPAWRARHDGLYADEADEGQHLVGVRERQRVVGCWLLSKQNKDLNPNPSLDVLLCFFGNCSPAKGLFL